MKPQKQPTPVNKNLKKYLLLILYQFGFCIVLVAFTLGCLSFYLSTLDPFTPRRRFMSNSTSPGLGFRPITEDVYSSLIYFRHGESGNWAALKKSVKDFLRPYGHGKFLGGSTRCKWHHYIGKETRCHVGKRRWIDWSTDVPCTKAEHYGYYHGQPCILLKVNKMYGWVPEPYYNISEVNQLKEMPQFLKNQIGKTWRQKCEGKGLENEIKCPNLRVIWISCEGVTPMDTEMMGPIHYTPFPGFPGYYFPYLNQAHYLSPAVWIQLRKMTPGVVLNIRCKLWAKNIQHEPDNPLAGGIKFELLMD